MRLAHNNRTDWPTRAFIIDTHKQKVRQIDSFNFIQYLIVQKIKYSSNNPIIYKMFVSNFLI